MIAELFRRLWFLLNRRRFERSLDDEMEFHREMMRRAGRAGFGNAFRLREQARDAWGWTWCDNLWRDFRYGVRTLWKSPGFTLAAVSALCLGIGGTTAMFSILYAALLKPLPYPDPGRLVFGRCTVNGQINPFVSAPDYYDYREQAEGLEGLAAVLFGPRKLTVTGGDEPRHAGASVAEPDLFPILGMAPAAGRWFTPEEGRA